MENEILVGTNPVEVEAHPFLGGVAIKATYENGYTASIIRHQYSYGNEKGLWELAVAVDGRIVYDTPITCDVLGNLTADEVHDALVQVSQLPRRQPLRAHRLVEHDQPDPPKKVWIIQ